MTDVNISTEHYNLLISKFDDLQATIKEGFAKMNGRVGELEKRVLNVEQFKWKMYGATTVIGLIFGGVGAVVVTFILRGVK